MNIFIGIVIVLVFFIIVKNILLKNKAKKILKSVSIMAIEFCEKEGVPIEFSQNAINTDYDGLLYHCRGAAKAMSSAPDLSDRGISSEAMDILSLQELAKEIAQNILSEYNQSKA